jgi:hypothetical protein
VSKEEQYFYYPPEAYGINREDLSKKELLYRTTSPSSLYDDLNKYLSEKGDNHSTL